MTVGGNAQAESLTPAELLARAANLTPILAQRAPETERLRRIPEENVAAVLQAGLHLIGVPRRFGGLDVD